MISTHILALWVLFEVLVNHFVTYHICSQSNVQPAEAGAQSGAQTGPIGTTGALRFPPCGLQHRLLQCQKTLGEL